MVLGICSSLNKFTPGMTFGHFANKVLFRGVGCGYIEEANKRRYVLTPYIQKLEHKMELNDFSPHYPKPISYSHFEMLKTLLKPFIKNEKGFKKMNLNNKNLFYSPSPASIVVYDKDSRKVIITIVKKLKHPLREIFFYKLAMLRKMWRIDPFKELEPYKP
jgi:hypothetical protein